MGRARVGVGVSTCGESGHASLVEIDGVRLEAPLLREERRLDDGGANTW